MLQTLLRIPGGMGHTLISQIVRRYSRKFFVKVEQISIQGDHCHLLIRAPRRAKFQAFFRVVSGQIAQRFQLEGLLKAEVADTPQRSRAGELRFEAESPGVTVTLPGLRARTGLRQEAVLRVIESNEKVRRKSPQAGTGFWKHRPFSRVVRGWRAYQIVRNYIQLNELEARGAIPYRKDRLKGMSSADWEILWA